MTIVCSCGAMLDGAAGELCGGAVCLQAPALAGVLCNCTLCGRVYVGTVDEVAAVVRRCKYHPDRAKSYGYRFLEAPPDVIDVTPAERAALVAGQLVEDERG